MVGVVQGALDRLAAGNSVVHVLMSISSRSFTLDEAASIFYMQAMWLQGEHTVLDHMVFNPRLRPGEAELVEDAWRQLPPQQREAVKLRSQHGLNYRDIAKRLHITEGAAFDELRDGLAGMREYLRSSEPSAH